MAAFVHLALAGLWGGLGTHAAPLPLVLWGSPTLRSCFFSLGFGASAPRKLLQAGQGGCCKRERGLKTLGGPLIVTPQPERRWPRTPTQGGSKVTLEVGFGPKCIFSLAAEVSEEERTLTACPHGGSCLAFAVGSPPHGIPPPASFLPHCLPPPHPTYLYPISHLLPLRGYQTPPGPWYRVSPGWVGCRDLPVAVGWEAMPHEVSAVLTAGSSIISGSETF